MRTASAMAALGIVVAAMAGCAAGERAWQSARLPTHDRDRAFAAAREVLGRRYGVADANWSRGVVEAKPQRFAGPGKGTLADLRGAGGAWRRTATCRIERDGLDILARVAVRLERDRSAEALAMADVGREAGSGEAPRTVVEPTRTGAAREAWVDAGYDRETARELLAAIENEVRRAGAEDVVPDVDAPRDLMEESKRIEREMGS
jgi:hypothetical protein